MADNVKVVVRVRPLIKRENDNQCGIAWKINGNVIQQTSDPSTKPYTFDHVFTQDVRNDAIYKNLAQPILEGAMSGFNGTIFAYGQTSSGKTHTMMGSSECPGIVPCVTTNIYKWIDAAIDREFLVRVAYMEIYKESVTDLFGDSKKTLEVRESHDGVFVNGLTEEVVTNSMQIQKFIQKGEKKRHFAATNMNERSSRSHVIVRLIIESRECESDGGVTVAHLNLVDLAGSEKADQTGATGKRLKEGSFINTSLFHLANVISQLSEGRDFVSYRDSKLTRILQNSLGGNSKTAIVCNVTPASMSIEETHSTLRFAQTAKRIKNNAKINEVLSDEAMLRRYKSDLKKLQQELDQMKKLEIGMIQTENMELQKQLQDNHAVQQQQQDKITRLTKMFSVSTMHVDQTLEAKRKRRETWCPGKARMSLAPATYKHPSFNVKDSIKKHLPESFAVSPRHSITGYVHHSSGIQEECLDERDVADESLLKHQVSFDVPYPSSSTSSSDASPQYVSAIRRLRRSSFELQAMKSKGVSWSDAQVTIAEEPENKDQIITELQNELITLREEKDSSIKQLEEEIVILQEERDSDLKRLQEKICQLQEDNEKTVLSETNNRQYNALESCLAETVQISETLQRENKDLKLQLMRMEARAMQLQMNLDRSQADFDDLKEQIEFSSYERDFKNQSILEKIESSEAGSEILENRRRLSMARHENGASQDSLQAAQKTISLLELEKKELSDQLHALHAQLDEAKLAVDEADTCMIFEKQNHKRRETELLQEITKYSSNHNQADVSTENAAEVSQECKSGIVTPLRCRDVTLSGLTGDGSLVTDTSSGVLNDISVFGDESEMPSMMKPNIYQPSMLGDMTVNGFDMSMLPDGAQGMMGFAMPREVTDSSTQTSDTWDSTTETLNQNISLNSTNTAAELTTLSKLSDSTVSQSEAAFIADNSSQLTGDDSADICHSHLSVPNDLSVVSTNEKQDDNMINSMTQQIQQLQSKCAQLTTDLDAAVSDGIDAQDELMDIKNAIYEKDLEVKTLREQLDAMKVQVELSKQEANPTTASSNDKTQDGERSSERNNGHVCTECVRLTTHLEDALADGADLQTKLIDVQKCLSEKEEEIVNLKKELEDFNRSEISGDVTTSEESRVENESLYDELKRLKEYLESSNADVAFLKSELEEKSAQNSTLATDLKDVRSTLTTYESERVQIGHGGVEGSDREILMERIKKLETNNDLNTQRCQKYEEKIKQLQDEVNKARSVDIPSPNESFSAKSLVEMTSRVKRAESQVEIKEHHMKKLEDECKELKQELRLLEELNAKHDQMASTRRSMDPDKLIDHIKKMETRLGLTTQRCENYEFKIKNLQVSVSKLEEVTFERNGLQSQVRELQNTLIGKDEEQKHLRQCYESYCAEVNKNKQQIQELNSAIEKYKIQICNIEDDLASAHNVNNVDAPSTEELEARIREVKEQEEQKYQELLESRLSELSQQKDNVREIDRNHEDAMKEEILAMKQTAIEETNALIKSHHQQIEELQQEKASDIEGLMAVHREFIETQQTTHNEELTKLQTKYKVDIENLQARSQNQNVTLIEDEVSSIKNSLITLQSTCELLEKEKRDLKQHLKRSQIQCENLSKKLSTTHTDAEDNTEMKQYNDLLQEFQAIEEKYLCLQTEFTQLQETHETLGANFEAGNHKIESMQEDYLTLSEKHSGLLTEFDCITDEHTALKMEYETIMDKYKSSESDWNTLREKYGALQSEYENVCDMQKSNDCDRCVDISEELDQTIEKYNNLSAEHDDIVNKYNELHDKCERGMIMYKNVCSEQEELCQQHEELVEKYNTLAETHDELVVRYDALSETQNSETGHRDQFLAKAEEWRKERKLFVECQEQLIEEKNSLTERQIEMNEERKLLVTEHDDMSLLYNNLASEFDLAKLKIEEITEIYEELLHTHNTLLKKNEELEQELQAATLSGSAELEQEIQQLKSKCSELQEELAESLTINRQLRSNIKELDDGCTRVETECDQLESERNTLKVEKQQLVCERDAVQQKLNDTVQLLDTTVTNDEIQQLKSKCSELKEELAESLTINRQLRSNIKELDDGCTRVETECDQLESERNTLKVEKQQLVCERDAVQQKLNDTVQLLDTTVTNDEIQQLKSKCNELKEELAESLTINRQLRSNIKELDDGCTRVETECDQLESERNTLKVEKQQLVCERDAVQQKLNDTVQLLDTTVTNDDSGSLAQKCKQLLKDLEKEQKIVTTWKARHKELDEACTRVESECDELESQRDNYKREKELLEIEVERLRNELHTARAIQHTDKYDANPAFSSDFRALRTRLESLSKENTLLKNRLETIEDPAKVIDRIPRNFDHYYKHDIALRDYAIGMRNRAQKDLENVTESYHQVLLAQKEKFLTCSCKLIQQSLLEQLKMAKQQAFDQKLAAKTYESKFFVEVDPIKDKVDGLMSTLSELKKLEKYQRSEIRRLQCQAEESMICPRCSSKENSSPTASTLKPKVVDNEIASSYYICQLEAEKGTLTREQTRLKKQLKDLQTDYSQAKDLLMKMQSKFKSYINREKHPKPDTPKKPEESVQHLLERCMKYHPYSEYERQFLVDQSPSNMEGAANATSCTDLHSTTSSANSSTQSQVGGLIVHESEQDKLMREFFEELDEQGVKRVPINEDLKIEPAINRVLEDVTNDDEDKSKCMQQ